MSLERICTLTGERFEITEFELDFAESHDVPLPEICPTERLRHLSTFRNRLHLYRGTCALTGKAGLTSIPPERGFTVYDVDVWDSDSWDALSYGRPYDFSRPFFEQFFDLLRVVPLPNLSVVRSSMENSDHTNGITGAKNCYLIFSSSFNEECMYGRLLLKCRNVYDSIQVHESELCYGCKIIYHCYDLRFCERCYHCSESTFLRNCHSCRNCFGCVNLSNREYCFYNEQLTKEEFKRRIAEIDLGSHRRVVEEEAKFQAFAASAPRKYIEGVRNEHSTGQLLSNTKNCVNCFAVVDAEDLIHCMYVNNAKSCIANFAYGNSAELIYESASVGDQSYNVKFCVECWPGARDLEYCMYVGQGSANCFGSVSLKHQSYCILNTAYSPGEYRDLVQRIKKQMRQSGEYGRFFPSAFSLHYYNKSEASDWFPLKRSDAQRLGYLWREAAPEKPSRRQEMPDHVRDLDESMLETPFRCETTGRAFKILRPELALHQRMNVALPRVSPFERLERGGSVLAVTPLRAVSCRQCRTPLTTAWAAESARDVLCEPCYQKLLIGEEAHGGM